VHGDGSCFFHSLAAAINFKGYVRKSPRKQQELGKDFRCRFKDHMRKDMWDKVFTETPHNKHINFREVKEKYCEPREWAEETMIKYTSEHTGLNILFIDGDTGKFYCAVQGDPDTQDTVVMAWVSRSHFEPVMFVRKRCAGHKHMSGKLSKNNKDTRRTIIRPLMEAVGAMCPV
jgi:hypothetical protein